MESRVTRKQKVLPSPEGKVIREVSFPDRILTTKVADQAEGHLVLKDEARVIFGKCGCLFFKDNLLSRGPCEHMVALLLEVNRAKHASAEEVNVAPAQDGCLP